MSNFIYNQRNLKSNKIAHLSIKWIKIFLKHNTLEYDICINSCIHTAYIVQFIN